MNEAGLCDQWQDEQEAEQRNCLVSWLGDNDISWYTYTKLGCSMLVRKINHHWADCITNIAANY